MIQTKIFKTSKNKKITAEEMQKKMNCWLSEQGEKIKIFQIISTILPLDGRGIGFESGVLIFYEIHKSEY